MGCVLSNVLENYARALRCLAVQEHKENAVFKSLGIMIGGIFVGAVGMELIRRKYPEALDKLCAKTCDVASGAKQAFKDGYEHATQPQAEATVAPTV